MKRLMLLVMFLVLIISYRPVIKKDLMDAGIRQFTFADLVKNPDL